MATRGSLSIPWPFEKMVVRLNTDTNLLKLIAIITMLIDHAGKMLFPQYRILRIIGRLAFPMFAYCLAVGAVFTKDMGRYISRIVFLALISQPIYAVALGHAPASMYAVSFAENPVGAAFNFYVRSWSYPSILLSLTLGLAILWSIRDRHLVLTVGLLLLAWIIQDSLDYGFRGIVMMLAFFLFCSAPIVSLPVVAGYMIWWGMQSQSYTAFGVSFGTQMFAVLALPLIYIRTNSRLKLNKWVFYLFYPAHLALILVLERLAVFG